MSEEMLARITIGNAHGEVSALVATRYALREWEEMDEQEQQEARDRIRLDALWDVFDTRIEIPAEPRTCDDTAT